MHYMRWIRVILPDVFKEFEVFYVVLATFCFSLSLSIGKRPTLGKINHPVSTRLCKVKVGSHFSNIFCDLFLESLSKSKCSKL